MLACRLFIDAYACCHAAVRDVAYGMILKMMLIFIIILRFFSCFSAPFILLRRFERYAYFMRRQRYAMMPLRYFRRVWLMMPRMP